MSATVVSGTATSGPVAEMVVEFGVAGASGAGSGMLASLGPLPSVAGPVLREHAHQCSGAILLRGRVGFW